MVALINSRFSRTISLLISVWMLYGGLAVCTQAAIVYEVIDLGTLGGDSSRASSINDAGQVVGEARDRGGSIRATLFDPTGAGDNINLGTLGGKKSVASSINDIGQIVGWSENSEYYGRATLFDITGMGNNIDLGTLGENSSSANCINNVGQIVGVGYSSGIYLRPGNATLFDPNRTDNNINLGTLGGFRVAPSINNAGQIVGELAGRAILFDPTGAGNNVDLGTLSGDYSEATSINDVGQIVGGATNSQGDYHATLFDPTGEGNNIDLDMLDGDWSMAKSINDSSQIVGEADNSTGDLRATLFDPTGAGNNIDLNTLINPANGWTLKHASDINNSAWIVGQGINPQGENHAFLLVPISNKYSGGTGEPNNPYQIATAEDLTLLGEAPEDYDKHFILTADIDLDPNLPGRKVFDKAVIAPDTDPNDEYSWFNGSYFIGVFDGNGHIISHLTIKGESYLGLFGSLILGAVIKDLGIVDVNIYGSGTNVGGLVGHNGYALGIGPFGLVVVDNCFCTGMITGNNNVGGLVGSNNFYGSISKSYFIGTVTGDIDVGGLVGFNDGDSSLTTSYSTATVSGGSHVGGLVGTNGWGDLSGPSPSSISKCYSTSTVTGIEYVGGLVGNNGGRIDTSYSTGSVSGDDDVGGLVGNDWLDGFFLDVLGSTTTSFWDIETSGQTTSAGGTGQTTAEMQTATTFLDAGWDFVDETVNGPNDIWKISEGLDYPHLWWEKYGGGTGEPNNPYLIYTTEHLNELGAERNDYNKHFKLMADIDFSGYSYDRAVIAPDMNDSGLQHEGKPFTGVLDGNGHAISNLTIEGHSFLGLFGYLDSDAIVSNLSIEAADISGISDFVGSLAGFNYGNIIGCCCTGDVSGNDNVGGLLGSNTIGGNINNCYSTVTVNGNEKVGGLVGYTRGSVTMCYSTGMVISEGQNAGGLVGERDPSYGIVTDCFWDTQTSGQATSAGGTGKTTAEMQTENTFTDAGWDFVDETDNGTEDIWWILEGQDYPRLSWEDSN